MKKFKDFICKIFGHKLYLDIPNTRGVAGPRTCKRCGYKKSGIEWPDPQ